MDEQQRCGLDRRLDNWGAWARSGDGGHGTCGSAERHHQPLRDDDGERLAKAARVPIDVADAELLERCILRLHRPLDKRLLISRYCDQQPKLEQAKAADVVPSMLEARVLLVFEGIQYLLDHSKNLTLTNRRMRRGLHSSDASNMSGDRPLNEVTAP